MVGRPEVLARFPELTEIWQAAAESFPVQITRSFWDRALASPTPDALLRQVLPSAAELDGDGLDDPVGDAARSPVPWVVHKYPNRVLWLVTKRCHLYCRYCFRRTFEPGEAPGPSEDEIEAAVAYVAASGAREVILSGGDPLTLRDAQLFALIDRLVDSGVRLVRIHSRAPITAPHRVTDALVAGLRARAPVWVVVHANHPDELSPEVDTALARLVDGGVPVGNQAVLLRGVNDDVDTLVRLFEAVADRRVRPYYLHHTDAVTGNAAFRVPLEEGVALYRALRARISGIALPRYVVDPPDGGGKIDAEAWLAAGEVRPG
jgi:lysine 2,3-aminomutase